MSENTKIDRDEPTLQPVHAVTEIQDISERRRSEQTLHESEERFRLLVEGVKDYAIFMLDPHGYVVSWNAGAERIKGYTAEEIIGEHFSRFYTQVDLERKHPEEELRVAETQGAYEEEGWRVRKDGTRFWASVLITALKDETETLRGFSKVTRDLTERKRAEDDLNRKERFRLLVENSSDIISVFDANGLVIYQSFSIEPILGYNPKARIGQNIFESPLTHPDDLTSKVEFFTNVRDNPGIDVRASFRLRHADGSWRHIEAVGRNLLHDPSVRGIIANYRDVTEKKRADEKLRQSEERFKATFEQAAVGISHNAADGRWLRVNQKLCDIVGYSREELLELTFQDLTYPDDLDADLEQVERLLVGEIPTYSMDKRYFRKDGSIIWANLTVSLVRDSSGEPEYFIAVIEDINQRKQADEEISIRQHQQEAVAKLGMQALAKNDPQVVMDEAVVLITRHLEVEYCKLLELLPGGEELILRAGVGWKEGLVGNTTVGAELNSQAGYTLLSDKPVIVEDLHAENRFSEPQLLHDHEVVSGMSTIIQGREAPFGVLGAHTTSHRTFTQDDMNFLQAVANVVATAVERKQAEEKLGEVREAERQRIARDLHDDALQDLSYALAETQLAQTNSKDQTLGYQLEQAAEALKRAGQGLRGAIYDLRLEERDREQNFVELLESLVELSRRRSPSVQMELLVEEGLAPSLSRTIEVELLHIVREALSNVRRHSEAHRVRVAAGASKGRMWAEVSDDGQGFNPKEVPAGMGIKGMRERAHALRGELKTISKPGEGTRVRFEMDLRREGKAPEDEVRVLLVEDHASFRQGVAALLDQEPEFSIVGQARSLDEARQILEGVDAAIVDLGLPDGYGGDLIKELRVSNPQAQALVLSASLERSEIARAVECGAAGVLHKSAGMDEIVEAVRRLKAGETLLPIEEVVELLRLADSRREEEHAARRAIARLTSREKEVLQALVDGLDSKGIAERLHISIETERNHMSSILTKLGVHSRLQALVFAMRHDVVG
ncbi:MAG: PAS domain S-box protein [Rubrobacter sp.]|nr:PAS domain S-box protein [Rubrobacter sp.]